MLLFLKASALALRPKQWIKNLLLFVAPFTAGTGLTPELIQVCLGFMAFGLSAGIGYIINDISDLELDRKHPKKKMRPFAAGEISIKSGILIATFSACGLLLILKELPLKFSLLIVLYLVNTFIYTRFLKKIPVIEMFSVTAGFVLRLVAGAVVIDLGISKWFLIVGGFGALFVISSKRLSELKMANSQEIRKVLNSYSLEFLQASSSISVAVCITAYTLWAFSQYMNPIWFQLSIVPFVIILFRYKWLTEIGNTEAPEEAILEDLPIVGLGFCCFLLLGFGIY